MNPQIGDVELANRLKEIVGSRRIRPRRDGAAAPFVARLGEVAARPDAVPIKLNGARIAARAGGTILGAAMKNGVRMMHACGARTLCATCRVKVKEGAENLAPMSFKEKLSLRYHFSVSPRTRLACQARVLGPVEVESIFPLCGSLPREQ